MSSSDVMDLLAIELIGIIPEDDRVVVASNRGEPAALDPISRAGEAYRRIARRLTGEIVPIEDPVIESIELGFWQSLLRMFRR